MPSIASAKASTSTLPLGGGCKPHTEIRIVEPLTQGKGGLLLLYADESLVSHVVTNQLKNAIEAEATAIDISAYTTDDDSVCIDISNNGKPIPPEEARQIFVPFFTTKPTGSGIGLSISQQIMKQSGGSIELVTSDSDKTLFRLTF